MGVVERETERNYVSALERNTVRLEGLDSVRQVPLIKHTNNELGVWKKGSGFKKRWDRGSNAYQNEEGRRYNKGWMPFFFTNFPDIFGMEQMRKVFLKRGNVRDVYIPRRRDKKGLRIVL